MPMDQAGFEPAWVYTMGLNRTVLNTPDQRDFSTALAVERAFNVCSRDLSRVSRRVPTTPLILGAVYLP